MTPHRPLQRLYDKHLGYLGVVTPLEKIVCAFIKKNPSAPSLWDELTQGVVSQSRLQNDDPWEHLSYWRQRLAMSLVASMQEISPQYQQALKENVSAETVYPFWEEFQLPAAMRALNRHLSHLPCAKINPIQLESGAVPLEWDGYWTWAEIPHVRFHAELGVLWCLLGKLQNDEALVTAAVRLAEWHLNTLDFHFFPFSGLFIQEADASLCSLLTNNYLLFHAVALLAGHSKMEYAAQRQMEYLEKLIGSGHHRIHPLAPLLEELIEQQGTKSEVVLLDLPVEIRDPHTDLAGYRSQDCNIVSTLFGGKTGLGCFHYKDVQVINYGPQHLPLSDCQGFGIEGGVFSYKNALDANKPTAEHGYHLKRQVRVAALSPSHQSAPLYRNGTPSGIWMEAQQHFHQGTLKIDATFLGLSCPESLAFTFFVKAKHCSVNGSVVNPRSLARYRGKPSPICLHGEDAALWIEAESENGELQVIPLAGGDNFWSADFLLAYTLDPHYPSSQWKIKIN